MINTFVGNFGHLLIITSFISSLMMIWSYFQAQKLETIDNSKSLSWKRLARISFFIHGAAIFGVVATLFYIIYNHLYEYHYAWSHSSNHLPTHYMISCFWEGQEGSFLLWVFWHVILGFILISTNKIWESSVMVVFGLVQAFLTSMILGVVIFNIKIGSSPFILLRDALEAPIFQSNPNYRPEDGTGLNPLLQNYWMVIHPPTLFLGFALTLVPFSYLIAGLWQKRYKDWIRPALPWALLSAGILGIGILMGAYWAYETLNFGGYWNWDPVENAVYIPWLVLVASIHTMISFRKSNAALTGSMFLVFFSFILILYSTFLTRSGVLGNASVHSFTDLGLSGQLLLYLLFFLIGGLALLIVRWKGIPKTEGETSVYSREFWIFIGATTLCLAAFQVMATTSIPVYNKIFNLLNIESNIALPADQVEHYTKFQVWFALLVALLSGTGQLFWWKKMDKKEFGKAITLPLILTLLTSAVLIALSGMSNVVFILLLTASVYSIISNLFILFPLLRKKSFKLSGGAVAHIGLAMMLVGILFSSGYSNVVSINQTGLLYSKDFSDEMNAENVLLWINQPAEVDNYLVTYKGSYVEAQGFPHYIKQSHLLPTQDPYLAIAMEDISYKNKSYYNIGDTITIYPENAYYRVEYRDKKGRIFDLYPRAQVNPQMGLLASPDISHEWTRDIYTHVSSIPDPSEPTTWSSVEEQTVGLRDTLFVNDYVAILEEVGRVEADKSLIQFTSNQKLVGIEAKLRILAEGREYEARPKYFINMKDTSLLPVPEVIEDLGVRLTLLKINPSQEDGQTDTFAFGIETTQKDYIIMKAVEKPFINVLWIGSLVLSLGFGIAIFRRYDEFRKMRDKGME